MTHDAFMSDLHGSRLAEGHARRMSFLHEISSIAISSLDAHDIVRRTAEVVHDRSDALFTSVRLANRERSRLHIVASHGLPAGYLEGSRVITTDASHLVPAVFKAGGPVWGRTVMEEPLGRALAEELSSYGVDPGTLLVLPLNGASSTVGTITLGWDEEREFTDDDVDFFASVANILAVGIENAHRFEDEREAAEISRTLSAAANRLAAEFGGIFESLTDAVVVLNGSGVVARTNDPARELFGFDPLGLDRAEFLERIELTDRSGTPMRRSDAPWEHALRGETVHNARLTIVAHETEMHVLVSAAPLVSEGVISGAVLVWRDVTEREKLLESLAHERKRIEGILTSVTDGFAVLDREGIFRYANQALGTMVDRQAEDLIGRCVWEAFPKLVGSELERAVDTVMEQGVALSFQQYYPPTDIWVEVRLYPTAEGVSIFVSDVSERRKAEQERERLLEAYELEIARTSLLKDTSTAAGGSLSAEEIGTLVLDTVRERLTPVRGSLHLSDEATGSLVLSARFDDPHSDVQSGRRLTLSADSPQAHLVTDGLPIVTHDTLPADAGVVDAADADERWLVLPVLFAGHTLGTLSLAFAGRRPFTEDEVSLFRSIAAQLGIALDNARLYQREHRIADTLQQSLLGDPADVEGLDVGRVYRSATENVRVGGDFYDVHAMPGGRVAISIGDVSGKGLVAAGVTALVRNTLRAHTLDGLPPHEVVRKVNEVLWYFSDSETFATAVYGVLDVESGRLEYCNGGHPAPLVLRADGSVDALGVCGPMLGAFAGLPYETRIAEIAPDDVLVLYTDGVVEARNNRVFFGEQRLTDMLAALETRSAEEVARAVAEAAWDFGGGVLRDDVAVVALKRS